VRDRDDPALPIVQRVIDRFPASDVEIVIDGRVRAANLKVANLSNMLERAKHEILVIADSDTRVDRRYLCSVVAAFSGDDVGAVTCLYNGTPIGGAGSVLGAMFINDHFAPSVLVALTLQKLRFCLGATMAVKKSVLAAIGGFNALASHIADDYMLGKLVSERGFRVRFSTYLVENIVYEPSLRSLWLRELRWARTIRAVRPVGYAFSFVTYALPVALLSLACSRNVPVEVGLFALSAALRCALHYAARGTFRPRERAAAWLIPFRDLLSFAVWTASFLGRGVRWRESDFAVHTDGSMTDERAGPCGGLLCWQ
jgi:ceramide glucosyltransferase